MGRAVSDPRQEWLDEMAERVNEDADILSAICWPTARDVWLRLIMMHGENKPFRLTTPWERCHYGSRSTYDMMKEAL